jgi:Fe-S-cluster containining protein
MTPLEELHQEARLRAASITAAHPDWPCQKGCDHCCRHLAREPLLTAPEWQLLASLPLAESLQMRIRAAAGGARPFVCPLLDPTTGACLVYPARPLACRTYGFYAERDKVLGCPQIEALSRDPARAIVWGNHPAIEARLDALGPALPLSAWLQPQQATAFTANPPSDVSL